MTNVECLNTTDGRTTPVGERVAAVAQRLLIERSIEREASPEEALRDIGLSSLDMVNLVLLIEAEFDITIPEIKMTPANFRCIAAISRLVTAVLQGA